MRTADLVAAEDRREEMRGWLRDHVPADPLPPPWTDEGFAAHRAWERTLHEAGYAALAWPREYGGGGGDLVQAFVFDEEYAAAGGPERINVIGLGLVGPCVMACGTEEQRRRWLPAIPGADEIWSQGFSEPGAGSDLAAVRTRAVVEADRLVVTGQKIWTTLGPRADRMLTLVRTGAPGGRHRGLTMVAIDLRAPGVEVRPIRQINGIESFAEVFLSSVEVPRADVIGAVDEGWSVAMTTLQAERGSGTVPWTWLAADLDQLVEIADAAGLLDDPVWQDRLGALAADVGAYRAFGLRLLAQLARGLDVGAEPSINKLHWSELRKRIYAAGVDILGPRVEVLPPDEIASAPDGWHTEYWYSRAATIYGGSTEIQRNVLAKRMLGLPAQPRAGAGDGPSGERRAP